MKIKRKNMDLDESFVNYMRQCRNQYSQKTGIPVTSDLKFSNLVIRSNLMRIDIPDGRKKFVKRK